MNQDEFMKRKTEIRNIWPGGRGSGKKSLLLRMKPLVKENTMGSVVRLNSNEVEMATDFLEKVKSGEVTHGIVCYRDLEGNIKYQLYSPEHLTYIIGMMERCKIAMN